MIGTYHELLEKGFDFGRVEPGDEIINDSSIVIDSNYIALIDEIESQFLNLKRLKKRCSSSTLSSATTFSVIQIR